MKPKADCKTDISEKQKDIEVMEEFLARQEAAAMIRQMCVHECKAAVLNNGLYRIWRRFGGWLALITQKFS